MTFPLWLESLWAELRFKQLVLQEPSDSFQRLFQRIMKAVDGDDFIATRPKGHYGDFKCDGWSIAPSTCYAVYGPFTRQSPSQVEAKVRKDFEGALDAWPDMRQWRFVHNDIHGLDPLVTKSIVALRRRLSDRRIGVVILPPWGPTDLWSYLRNATTDARSDVLGQSGWVAAATDFAGLSAGLNDSPVVKSACASVLQLIDGYAEGGLVDPLSASAFSATLTMCLLGDRASFDDKYSRLEGRYKEDPFEAVLTSVVFCVKAVWLWTRATQLPPSAWAAEVASAGLTDSAVTNIVLDAISNGNDDAGQPVPGHPDDQNIIAMNLGLVTAYTVSMTAAAQSTYPVCALQDLFIQVQRDQSHLDQEALLPSD